MQLYILKNDSKKVLAFEPIIADLKTKGLGKEKMAFLIGMTMKIEDYKRTL